MRTVIFFNDNASTVLSISGDWIFCMRQGMGIDRYRAKCAEEHITLTILKKKPTKSAWKIKLTKKMRSLKGDRDVV